MEKDFRAYLEEGTKKLLDILSSLDISEEERAAVVESYSDELRRHIGEASDMGDCEPVSYGILVQFIDRKISEVLADESSSYSTNESAIRFCQRQQDLLALFREHGWELPALDNPDMDKCLGILKHRQDSILISTRIINEDKQIDKLLGDAQSDMSLKACDIVLARISELEEDMALCETKNIPLPPINNKDTKDLKEKLSVIYKSAEQKESLYRNIHDMDYRIHDMISLRNTTPDQWQEIVDLCQRQREMLSECNKNGWDLPEVRYDNPEDSAARYRHYLEMISMDRLLSAERDSLSTDKQFKKQYNDYCEHCEKQIGNIDICLINGWDIPDLKVRDPSSLLKDIQKEQNKRVRSKKVKRALIITGIVCLLVLGLAVFGVYKYMEGRIQIPFDPSYVAGEELKDIYDDLEQAGFENISKKQVDSGWLNSGQVTGVSIDNSTSYKKGSYIKPDVKVVINYSSDDRIYVTDILKDWQQTDYKTVMEALKKAGLTNITVEELVTSDKEKDKLTAALSLNGEDYSNEKCYLPKNAPIVISYYALKIGIGNDSAQFIGQNYRKVVLSLKESGFTNVQTQKIVTGWAKGNTVVGVTVNNVDSYKSSESFDPNVKIVVKFSSDDRINATSIMEGWQTKNYEELIAALEAKGFTNISTASKETSDSARNHLAAGIILNNEKYKAGDCYLQAAAPIQIEYYSLAIKIGKKASDIKGEQYSDIVAELKKKGFTNISLRRADNLITGWITKEGSIKDIKINGKSDFEEKDSFGYDAPIEITVNTFEGKGCKDIKDIAK